MFCVATTELETKMNITKGGLVLFSANSNSSCMELSKKIADFSPPFLFSRRLGVEMGKVQVYQEPNRETRVQIQESVRGKDVFIIQTVSNKQCKMRKRGSIVSKLLASMMCKAGLTHLITMDLHQKEIQGFFNIPVDNLRASPFLLQYIQEEIPDYRNAVIVAKSPASAKRAQSFAERLRLGIAVIHGEAQDAESDLVDGRHSPPMVRSVAAIHPSLEIPMLIPKEKPPITVVGDVGGRIAIIVDDIIDDVDSFLAAAETLKERGAYKIFVMATHGLLSSDAPRLIEESAIDEVVVTNTIPHEIQKLQCPKIKTVDISMILSEAIRRIHNGESMSYLFRNIGLDD
ncbi:phosphoribosyl pyrophosphate synthase-associated protein 2 isoform X3 [Sturnira hondurensis]|uniref:phosphoribosyl pyrophosphate synthase-associated protein 2 isoform X3 n=1 Tax=Sturnira hondurensis TaxID=192404 RepID=UPI0018795996|nr:phosphoribosyl pyrophosphate synthase-associated protein 2 isoform X3 [Sturnira hondurensis]